jgi:type II secretory pathway component PulF
VFLAEFVGRFESAYETFRLPISGSLRVLIAMRSGMSTFAWIPPALLLLSIAWWIYVGRRRVSTLAGFPFVGAKSFRYAMFADLLAMQVDHAVSLPEGIVLAAEATGSPAMRDSAQALATHVSQGGALSDRPAAASAFPPFLYWLMVRGQQQGKLAQALRLAADMYRRRAINRLNWFKVLFPVISGVVIGGGATLFYALGLFLPFINMLSDLGASEVSPFR